MDFGWDLHGRRISRLGVNIENLDRGILNREDGKTRLNPPRLRQLVLGLFLPTSTQEISQVNSF